METTATPLNLEALMAHVGWARALARRLVGDPDVAEDLVQETLVAGWKHPPALDRPLRPWLATVLRNLARSRGRGEGRARVRHDSWQADAAAVVSPEEALGGLQAQQRLASMLARLSEPYRHAIYLRHVEGLSAAEIARSQGVPEGTVRWRIKTGLDQLRQWFAEEDGPEWRRALLPLTAPAAVAARSPVAAGGAPARAAVLALGVAAVVVLLAGSAALLRHPAPPRGVSALPEDPTTAAAPRPLPSALGSLHGRVLGPDGTPVPGAVVMARGPGAAIDPQVALDDGHFRFGELPPGWYTLTASAATFLPASSRLRISAGADASAELRLQAGGAVVRGQVLDAAAGPVPFARIEADRDSLRAVVLADQQGRFALRLPLGGHDLTASADGYARGWTRVELAGDLTHDFFLQPAAAVAGQVLDADSGEPVTDAFVQAEEVDRRQKRSTRSGVGGRFRLDGLEPGQYRLFARKSIRVGFAPAPVTLAIAARVEGVKVPLSRSFSVSGRVLDSDGQPRAGAQVGIEEARGAPIGFSYKEVKATTDQAGHYRIDGLVPGVYHLSAHAAPFGDAEDVTAGVVDADREVDDLRLSPAAKVAGRVVAADGTAVSGVEVELQVRASLDGNGFVRGRTRIRTDRDGRFAVGDLGAGWLTARVRGPRGDSTEETVEVAPGRTSTLELRFAPAAFIEGRVRWTDGRPAERVDVVWSQRESRAVTGTDGRYRLGPLAPGRGYLHAERPGASNHTFSRSDPEPSERDLQLRPGETLQTEDLILPRGDRSISGMVLGPDGSPLAGATLDARPTGKTPDRAWVLTRVVSDAEGRFTIPALTAGAHLVHARDPRFPPAETEAEGGNRDVRVRFAAAARLAGTLVDGAGRPVPVATVRVVPTERLDRDRWTFGSHDGTERRVQDSGRALLGRAAGRRDLRPAGHHPFGRRRPDRRPHPGRWRVARGPAPGGGAGRDRGGPGAGLRQRRAGGAGDGGGGRRGHARGDPHRRPRRLPPRAAGARPRALPADRRPRSPRRGCVRRGPDGGAGAAAPDGAPGEVDHLAAPAPRDPFFRADWRSASRHRRYRLRLRARRRSPRRPPALDRRPRRQRAGPHRPGAAAADSGGDRVAVRVAGGHGEARAGGGDPGGAVIVYHGATMPAPSLLAEDGSASIATGLMMSHHGMRRDLARFALALRRVTGGDHTRVEALKEEWKSFHGALHGHHEAEDTGLFPHVRGERPALVAVIEKLTADHRQIDPILEQGDQAFAGLPATAGDAAQVVARLSALLDPHLATEEEHVIPVLRGIKTFPEFPEAELDIFAQGFAWASDGIAPEVLERVNDMLPEALRARLPAARAAFVKRSERVWGPTPPGASRTPIPDWLARG